MTNKKLLQEPLIKTKNVALKIAQFARDKKAQKVVVLDVSKISTFCDFFVVASGTSLRQVNALAQNIRDEMEKNNIKLLSKLCAQDESGWVVLDFASVIVHIFHEPVREFYSLERLWSDAKRVRIPKNG